MAESKAGQMKEQSQNIEALRAQPSAENEYGGKKVVQGLCADLTDRVSAQQHGRIGVVQKRPQQICTRGHIRRNNHYNGL